MSVAVILGRNFSIFKIVCELNNIIAVCIKISALLLLASISVWPDLFRNYTVLYISAFLYGTSFFIWPSITGLLTKYLNDSEQGTGFGVIDAWTAVATVLHHLVWLFLCCIR